MNWGLTGLLIVFGAFILLVVFKPNMSCFGRRLKSPFYPLMRRRKILEGRGPAGPEDPDRRLRFQAVRRPEALSGQTRDPGGEKSRGLRLQA